MTTAAIIDVKLTLDNKQFQQGMEKAEIAAGKLSGKLKQLDGFLRRNSIAMGQLGQAMMEGGKKMTLFISVPIIGFFALLIKKALDADTALAKLGKESLAQLNAQLVILGTKFLPLFIRAVDWLTRMVEKFNNASPKMQKFITMMIALAALAGPIMAFTGWLVQAAFMLGQMGITAGTVGTALSGLFTYITATAIPAIVAFTAANAAWIVPLLLVAATAYLVYKAFKTNFGGIATTAKQLWFIIKYVFSGIISAIGAVINAVGKMISAFARIKLPKLLRPGSPTPFEMGLRGISAAMDELSRKSLPKLNAGFNLSPAMAGGGAGRDSGIVNYTDNRRFSAGMGAEELRAALDNKFKQLSDRI